MGGINVRGKEEEEEEERKIVWGNKTEKGRHTKVCVI